MSVAPIRPEGSEAHADIHRRTGTPPKAHNRGGVGPLETRLGGSGGLGEHVNAMGRSVHVLLRFPAVGRSDRAHHHFIRPGRAPVLGGRLTGLPVGANKGIRAHKEREDLAVVSTQTTRHLFGRLAIALWRGNATLWLRRAPSLPPSADGII